MINWVHPAFIFILGALVLPFLQSKSRKLRLAHEIYVLVIPFIGFANLLLMEEGTNWSFDFFRHQVVIIRVDKLSLLFGYVFVALLFLGNLYSLHIKRILMHPISFVYAGATLGVVFAGDFISLYFFWEAMAIASTFMIWTSKRESSRSAGFRFISIHLFGGLCLLVGFLIHYSNTGSIAFHSIEEGGIAFYLILVAFLINAAVPPFSAWLPDSYPESTPTGTVFLSGFTTKSAIYVLVRMYPETELLIWMGIVMTFYGVVFATLENNIRRLLAYHVINQVGYMVTGIGIGTSMAINGVCALAFSNILYKALLFMCAGAIVRVTGTNKLTELGGLYKFMPVTFYLYMLGAVSISAFPLFNGFISKSIVVSAAAEDHRFIIWALLTLASCGTFLSVGLKLPYFAFFGKDCGKKPKEPLLNMIIAMGITAFLCFLFGVYPDLLYNLLPYQFDYQPYTASHIVGALQFLMFTALAFFLLLKKAKVKNTLTLDTDWTYRMGGKGVIWLADNVLFHITTSIKTFIYYSFPETLIKLSKDPKNALKEVCYVAQWPFCNENTRMAMRTEIDKSRELHNYEPIKITAVGGIALIILIFLSAYLLVYFLNNKDIVS